MHAGLEDWVTGISHRDGNPGRKAALEAEMRDLGELRCGLFEALGVSSQRHHH